MNDVNILCVYLCRAQNSLAEIYFSSVKHRSSTVSDVSTLAVDFEQHVE